MTTPCILFVDDEPGILDLLQDSLEPTGYRCFLAQSGREALEILEREPVDLILSDMRMPGMTGAQLLEQVADHWPDVVRMVVTGYTDVSSAVEAINRGGIQAYIEKPWDPDELVRTVTEAMEEKLRRDSEARQSEQKLERVKHQRERAEQVFQAITNTTHDAVVIVDDQGRVSYWNQGAADLFGYPVEKAAGQDLHALIAPERFHADFRKGFEQYRSSGQGNVVGKTIEIVARRDDGSEFPVELAISALKTGDAWHSLGIVRDISERAAAAKEREKLIERLNRLVIDLSSQRIAMNHHCIVSFMDAERRLTDVNDKFCEISGYDREELIGTRRCMMNSDLQSPEYLQSMFESMGYGNVWSGRVGNYSKAGEVYWMETTVVPFPGTDGRPSSYIGLHTDVTSIERARAEQEALAKELQEAHDQLLQSEKMASIGQLAAGVAHEINNPVGYVSSNIGTLKGYLEDLFQLLDGYERLEASASADDAQLAGVRALKDKIDIQYLREDIGDLLDESKEGTVRVKKIVQDLKDFSHVDKGEWKWEDLHHGLNSTLNIVHNELKYKCEVVKEYAALPQIECMISQLNQVFMNLLVNAAHAIETRGVITVRTGTEGDDHVWVEVSDTGKGIPEEQLARIFDPFFTTKPVGKGTGLGLSLSYGIVKKHGGKIAVRSKLGEGTTFRVEIPISQAGRSEQP